MSSRCICDGPFVRGPHRAHCPKKAVQTFVLANEDIIEYQSVVEGATAKLEVTLLPPKPKRKRRRARSV